MKQAIGIDAVELGLCWPNVERCMTGARVREVGRDRNRRRSWSWAVRLLGIETADVNQMAVLAVRTDERFGGERRVVRTIGGISDRRGRRGLQLGTPSALQ